MPDQPGMSTEQAHDVTMCVQILVARKPDGTWQARLTQDPSIVIDGDTREEAFQKAKALALRLMAEAIEEPATPISRSRACE